MNKKIHIKKINKHVLPPWWVTAFIDGEGNFHVGAQNNDTMALKKQIQLQFSITQNNRDTELMNLFPKYFNAGSVTSDGRRKKQFRIRDFEQLKNLFIHLEEYPLLSKKILDFQDFLKVYAMMEKKLHLTQEGLKKILEIKDGMGRKRKFDNEPER